MLWGPRSARSPGSHCWAPRSSRPCTCTGSRASTEAWRAAFAPGILGGRCRRRTSRSCAGCTSASRGETTRARIRSTTPRSSGTCLAAHSRARSRSITARRGSGLLASVAGGLGIHRGPGRATSRRRRARGLPPWPSTVRGRTSGVDVDVLAWAMSGRCAAERLFACGSTRTTPAPSKPWGCPPPSSAQDGRASGNLRAGVGDVGSRWRFRQALPSIARVRSFRPLTGSSSISGSTGPR